MSKTLILIPARLAASRLPRKPLLKINGLSLINHMYKIAQKVSPGNAFVVTGDIEIYKEVINNSGKCILTLKNHKTGTDRIFEGFQKFNKNKYRYVLNLQGDEPLININDIKRLIKNISSNDYQMCTLACKLKNKNSYLNKNIVKVITDKEIKYGKISKANNFKRILKNEKNKNIYHHIGVYIYKKETLAKIVSLPQTRNEKKYKLEQLRALENKIAVGVCLAKQIPIGVDTKEDFNKVKKILELNN